MSFRLSVFTPDGKIFDDQIEALQAPGQSGSFGVLSAHVPIVSALSAGVLKLTQNNQEKYYGIGSGILEVNHEHNVLILSEAARSVASREEAKSSVQEHQKT